MVNRELRLFYISQLFAYAYFWLSIAIPYLSYRGLSSAEIFSLMSLYQLAGVFLEYPTGLIGDLFGHRKATYVSNILNCLAMLMMVIKAPYWYYLLVMMVMAVGNALSSGNDMGILKKVATNIKKDTANYNAIADLALFASAIIGGLIGQYSLELALVISGLLMLSANIPLYFIGDIARHQSLIESPLELVREALVALRKPVLKNLFLIIASFGGLAFSVKTIIGSYGDLYHISVAQIGYIVGFGGLARALGGKLFAERPLVSTLSTGAIIAFCFIMIGLSPTVALAVVVVIIVQVLFGYLGSALDTELQRHASDKIRASLFSFKRLTMRLVASSYLLIYGIALGHSYYSLAMVVTGLILGLIIIYANFSKHKLACKL